LSTINLVERDGPADGAPTTEERERRDARMMRRTPRERPIIANLILSGFVHLDTERHSATVRYRVSLGAAREHHKSGNGTYPPDRQHLCTLSTCT
jgi:hypothetical protein